jgi:multidrug efflux pump subunit AcrB
VGSIQGERSQVFGHRGNPSDQYDEVIAAAAVGLVIDDAIVMIEHVIRRLQGGIGPWRDRVLTAAREFTRPLVGSSATTIIIFVPPAFLSGVTGAFFKALSLTMAASLVISFLIAWLAVPLLALHVLRGHDAKPHTGGTWTTRVHTMYTSLMTCVLGTPWLMDVVLVPVYESLRVAAVMLLTTLLTIPAVFLGLWWTGTELNVTSLMGLTMVLGIVTEVGIFYYCEYQDLRDVVDRKGRLIQAGLNRLRPITMTTLAAILTLLPLALAIGEGSAMQTPLAIAIISGLLVQVPLVVIVLPTLLMLFTTEVR